MFALASVLHVFHCSVVFWFFGMIYHRGPHPEHRTIEVPTLSTTLFRPSSRPSSTTPSRVSARVSYHQGPNLKKHFPVPHYAFQPPSLEPPKPTALPWPSPRAHNGPRRNVGLQIRIRIRRCLGSVVALKPLRNGLETISKRPRNDGSGA